MGFEPTVLAGTPDFKCRLLFLKRTQRILQGPSEVPLRFLLSLLFLPFFERCPVRIPCHNSGRKAIHKSQRKILSDGGAGSTGGKSTALSSPKVGKAERRTIGSSFDIKGVILRNRIHTAILVYKNIFALLVFSGASGPYEKAENLSPQNPPNKRPLMFQ